MFVTKVVVDGWVKGHSNSECKVRMRRNLIYEDLVSLLPLVFLLEMSCGSFSCIRYQPSYWYNQDSVKFLISAVSFSYFSYYCHILCASQDNSVIWKGKKSKLNMLLAISGGSFSVLYLNHSLIWPMDSMESSRTCSCFAFTGALNLQVWKGTFGETSSHITLFSEFDCCMLQKRNSCASCKF